MGKKNVIKIAVLVGILALVVIWRVFFGDSYKYDGIVSSEEEMYAMINQAVMKGKGDISFKSYIAPAIDFDRILADAVKDESLIGCELYSLKYLYTPAGGYYDVSLQLNDPSRYASFMLGIRAGRIAGHFEDLPSDYEKVKATHDYIVLLNRYVYFEGGAYSALFKERSSCTGYAYAFYAIMNKLNIPVTIEVGGAHAWNRVQVDGKWYNIDCTWDDDGRREVSYDYFLKCDADWRGHHHGGSDAEYSLPVKGASAREYYDMVPGYNRFKEILIIAIFVVPVGILAFILYKKGKREKDIINYSLMSGGDWYFMHPLREGGRYDVIIKKMVKPVKSEIWYCQDGKYYIETSEEKNPAVQNEISSEKFFAELNFVISVARSKNATLYKEALERAQNALSGGNTELMP